MRLAITAILLSLSLLIGQALPSAYYTMPKADSRHNTRTSSIAIRPLNSTDTDIRLDVSGSVSGAIAGRQQLARDGQTTLFTPFQPFTPDEMVTVQISHGGENSSFSFHVSAFSDPPNPYALIPELRERYLRKDKTTSATKKGAFPAITVDVYDEERVGEGHIYMAVASEVEGIGYYLMLLNNDGTPFFSRALSDDYAYDFKQQEKTGLYSYAQFIEHHSYTGGGNVIHMVMDASFTVIDSFQMGNGYVAEAHDFQMLANGHVLLFGYYLTPYDMSQRFAGGYPNALISGGIVQELDEDKNVVFQWRSWDYYDFDTYEFNPRFVTREIVSEFHLNTINLDTDNNIFLATPQWTKKISRRNGDILWHLGGNENEFSFTGIDSIEAVDHFGGHAFHRLANGNVLVFDNGDRQGKRTSRVHEYSLDEERKMASWVWTYAPDTLISSWHRGNAQRLPNGNTLIGWGGPRGGDHIPAVTEVTAAGEKVYELSFDDPGIESYRAFRFPFNDGQPVEEVVEAEVSPGGDYIFMAGDRDTGVRIRVMSLEGSGYNEIRLKTYAHGPRKPQFLGKSPRLLAEKIEIEQFGLDAFRFEVKFHSDLFQIETPEVATIYRRQFPGSGAFTALPTAYNPVQKIISAETEVTGEFIIGWPDLSSLTLAPRLLQPIDSAEVNQELPVYFEWNPLGYSNEYDLVVATDMDFANIVHSASFVTSAFREVTELDAATRYYWRVKSYNDVGESEWSATRTLLTVPPALQLTFPAEAAELQVGLDYFIQWQDNITEDVVLRLRPSSATTATILDTTTSNGAYRWSIAADAGLGEYYLAIASSAQSDLRDSLEITLIDTITTVAAVGLPGDFALEQNYPNPFNPTTSIRFRLPQSQQLRLMVFNMRGQHVATLAQGVYPAGQHEVFFSAENLATGIYIYRLQSAGFSAAKKMLLIK
jgi:hypothetical protein